MLSTTEAYKSAVVATSRVWRVTGHATLDDSTVIPLSNSDFKLSTISYKEGATCVSTIQVGSTFANSLDFALLNVDNKFTQYNFKNAVFSLYIGLLVGNTFEDIPLGKFNVATCGQKLSSIPISCFDDMYKLNVPMSSVGVIYPCSISTMFNNICTYCGVTAKTELVSEIVSLDTRLGTDTVGTKIGAFDQTKFTCRDILGFIGCLLGKNLRFDRYGILESFWYSNNSQETNESTRVRTAWYSDDTVTITGIDLKDSAGVVHTYGSRDYVVSYATNPLIQSDAVANATMSTTSLALSSVPYRPCQVDYIGDPAWQAGDVVSHSRNGKETIVSPIMVYSFKYAQHATIEAKGETQEANRQLTADAKKVSEAQIKQAADLNAGLSSMEKLMLDQSNFLTNALGFYPYAPKNPDGSLQGYYMMDNPDPNLAETIWAFTSGGIGVSHTGIAGPYTSSWTATDSIIASVVTANLIRTGVIQSKDDTLRIDLGNGQILALNDAGSTSINGNSIVLKYRNNAAATKPDVAHITIEPDTPGDADNVASMRIEFATEDGTTKATMGMEVTHSADSNNVTDYSAFTISHDKPIRIARDLSVDNAIVYDHIIMQRKSGEVGNTGVDFVFKG